MKIIACKDYEAMSRAAADIIAAQVILKPNCVLGLATGGSPVGTYQELVRRYEAGELDFSQVKSVNLDEYVGLGYENDQSYIYFMRSNLFDHVNIDLNNTNVPNGHNADAEAECARYDALIASYGGIDLQLLGLGPNGHIGFNEPDDHFSTGTHKVTLTQSTIEANKRFFASIDDVPRYAYTMGCREIMQAKRVLMVVSGEGKAETVKKAFFGPVTPLVPASLLQLHKNFTLVADEAALSLVK
ncbi:MAG: glucosamine-6-phosphate deaminase [bacterium]